jgi:glyoxylase-like metal-dependent hydrolase (beta-lactamase superfamily II)
VNLSITAVSVGRVFELPMPSFTYLRGWGQTLDLPLIMYVIQGGERPIVVDTGADLASAWDRHEIRMEQAPDEQPLAALRSVGVDPDDVSIVVNTHLHWDHSSNNHLFPNAEILVQRQEIDYALAPVPWHRQQFEAQSPLPAAWERAKDRIRAIDGDTPVAPSIAVVSLPGHTPGSQGVLVESTSGTRYLIAGDCIYLHENWEGDESVDHIPVGLFTDLIAYDASLRKIESLECEVIPSHDFRVLQRRTFD